MCETTSFACVCSSVPRPLNRDELSLLRALHHSEEPLGIFDVAMAVNPEWADGEKQAAWLIRHLALSDLFIGLYKRGLVEEALPPGGNTGDRYRLTPAGHAVIPPSGKALSERDGSTRAMP